MKKILAKAANIKLLITDVDGVLTDGKIYLSESGSEYKVFYAQDGVGLKLLILNGVEVATISGRQSTAVEHRLRPLGVKHIYQGIGNKAAIYNELKSELKLKDEEIAAIGDDLPDLPMLTRAGFAIAVADADNFIKDQVDWITPSLGGRGAIRETCELILQAKKRLQHARNYYLNQTSNTK